MLKALLSGEFVVEEYALIVVACGACCGLKGGYDQVERNRDFLALKDELVKIAHNRDRGTVLFCCGFQNGDLKDTVWHNRFVEKHFSNTNVKCVSFVEENPFFHHNGRVISKFFDQSSLPHLSPNGFDCLWVKFCEKLPRLRFVPYKTSHQRHTRPKSDFEHSRVLSRGLGRDTSPRPESAVTVRRRRQRSPLGNLGKMTFGARRSPERPKERGHVGPNLRVSVTSARKSSVELDYDSRSSPVKGSVERSPPKERSERERDRSERKRDYQGHRKGRFNSERDVY